MPNHCLNRITIHVGNADGHSLEVLIAALQEDGEHGTAFDFNAILPMPAELRNTRKGSNIPDADETKNARLRKEHGADNWYDWSCHNWGTKWNSYESSVTDHEVGLFVEFEFSTAWGPPTEVIDALREQCPELSISAFYDEPGMEIAGYY